VRTLAIDTSGDLGVVAVTVDGEVRAELHARARSRHGETLLPTLERALALAELGIESIDLLAVGLGPGSFTGVRIGVSFVKGLALARGTPLVGVRTTRVVARGLFGALRAPVIDAHKGEVFVALYQAAEDGSLGLRLEETHGTPEAAAAALRRAAGPGATLVVGGSGLALHRARFLDALAQAGDDGAAPGTVHVAPGTVHVAPGAYDVPRGALLALEAEEALRARGPDPLATLEPLYVRASDAVLPASASTGGVGAGAATER
jgi:tRNA threonylcarbamoyladenosine biosynthesis protein TsaB